MPLSDQDGNANPSHDASDPGPFLGCLQLFEGVMYILQLRMFKPFFLAKPVTVL